MPALPKPSHLPTTATTKPLRRACHKCEPQGTPLAELKARGVAFVDGTPRVGAGGCGVAFVHPGAATGVLLELKETPTP